MTCLASVRFFGKYLQMEGERAGKGAKEEEEGGLGRVGMHSEDTKTADGGRA